MEKTIIIVVEKPSRCYYCRFCKIDEYDVQCVLTGSYIDILNDKPIQNDCPLDKNENTLYIPYLEPEMEED